MNEQPIDYERRVPSAAWWRRHPVAIAVLGILALLLLVSMLLPTLHTRDNWMHGNGGKCMSNLRQIGLAMQMYANDNRGRLPPDLATLLVSEDLTSEVFLCPSTPHERATGATTQAVLQQFAAPGHCSYVLASPLPQTWSALTPNHIVAHEFVGNHYGAGTNILFGDGRCEFVDDARAAYLIAELKAGHNPPRPKSP